MTTPRSRPLRWAAAISVVAVGTAACGNGPAHTSQPQPVTSICPAALPASSKPLNIKMWGYPLLDTAGADALAPLVDEFNRAQTAVHVELSSGPRSAGSTNRTMPPPQTPPPPPPGPPPPSASPPRVTAGRFFRAEQDHQSPPDIVELPDQAARAGIDSGFVVPVQTCIDSARADLSGFVPAALAEARLAGVQWGLPLYLNGTMLLYNTQALARAAVDHPPADLSSLVADTRALQDHGIASPLGDGFPLLATLRVSGVDLVDHDNGQTGTPTAAALDTPTTRDVLGSFKQLMDHHALLQLPPPSPGAPTPGFAATADGRIAIAAVNTSAVAFLASGRVPIGPGRTASIPLGPNVTLGLGPFPSLHGPGSVEVWSDYLFLSKASSPERRAASWRFLSWLEQPAQQARLAAATGLLPDQLASANDPAFAPTLARYPLVRQAWTVMTTSPFVVQDLIGPWGPIEDVTIGRLFDDLRRGTTIGGALTTAVADIDRWLKQYNADPAGWDRCYGLDKCQT